MNNKLEYDANEIMTSFRALISAAYEVDQNIFCLNDLYLQSKMSDIHNAISSLRKEVKNKLNQLSNE